MIRKASPGSPSRYEGGYGASRGLGGLRRSPLPWLGGLLGLYLLVPIAAQLWRVTSNVGVSEPTAGLGSALAISMLTATISSAIIALLGIPLAWTLSQARGRAWEIIGVAVQLPLALPPLMSGILLVELFGPYRFVGQLFGGRLTTTAAGIVLAQTFVASPFLVIAARSAFSSIDPGLLEMASTLGHRSWSRFGRVSLPLAAPGIRAGLLLTWLRAFGEFGATEIVAYHPYSLPVFTFVQFDATGLPATLAPTGAAILAAIVVLALARWRPLRWIWAQWGPKGRAGAALVERGPGGRGLAALGMGLAGIKVSGRNDSATPQWAGEGTGHGAGSMGAGSMGAGSMGAPTPGAGAAGRTATGRPPKLAFDLDTRLGNFELRLEHRCSAPHLAILGPSGAGKSLTLRCLAGLRGPKVGTVKLGERRLGALAPEDRRIGWVPQDSALFPHLSVWRQLTFGVGTDPALAKQWIVRLGLCGLEDRLPHQLSGGQRQRVALARALARAPDIILLDEPFSALDKPVRDQLRRELRRLQAEIGIATVLVTHDPEEAAILADEVIIIDNGRSLQAGTREVVFRRPASPQVARLLGIENLRTGTMLSPTILMSHGAHLCVSDVGIAPGSPITWCIRSEHLLVRPESDTELIRGTYGATVLEVLDLGCQREVSVQLDGGLELTATTLGDYDLAPGQGCNIAIPPGAVSLWSAQVDELTVDSPKPSGAAMPT